MNRCQWCGNDSLYIQYHDQEWGVPVHNDRVHFEFMVLESAQAGLSWITVLRKRKNYRRWYENFDPEKVALFDEKKTQKMLADPGIIRNRLKIESSVKNAGFFLDLRDKYGSFDHYLWDFVDHKPIQNHFQRMEDVPSNTALSDAISKDLKKRGFRFMGTTIVYAHMQAVGLVNDHTTDCFRHREILDQHSVK